MDKRLAKRHKRQVARDKMKIKLSEPDVRTPEQIEAAKQASHYDTGRGNNPSVSASTRRGAHSPVATTGGAAKTAG
jgi:hypothetical protein